MDRFDIWGQVQEIAHERYLAIAIACPEKGGGQTLFSRVLEDRERAAEALQALIEQLEEQVRSGGDAVAAVHELPDNAIGQRPGAWFESQQAAPGMNAPRP